MFKLQLCTGIISHFCKCKVSPDAFENSLILLIAKGTIVLFLRNKAVSSAN